MSSAFQKGVLVIIYYLIQSQEFLHASALLNKLQALIGLLLKLYTIAVIISSPELLTDSTSFS